MSVSEKFCVALAATFLAATCGSSQGSIATSPTDASVDKSLRVLGRDNDVRIEAQVLTNEVRQAGTVSIAYEIENFRSEPIAFIPAQATVDYEPGSRTLTVGLGSEIPAADVLPRLIRIAPGERKTFTTGAHIAVPGGSTTRTGPRFLQVRLSYLDGAEAFEPLIASGGAAAEDQEGLFRSWLDHIAAVVTNALPIRWAAGERTMMSAADRAPARLP